MVCDRLEVYSPKCLELDFSHVRAKGIDMPLTSMPQK
jgi:hypothetical protein